MTELLIPVKPLADVKRRLANVLNAEQRAGLVVAMLSDMLEAASQVSGLNVWVVTCDKDVQAIARQHAVAVIEEPVVEGYNSALMFGRHALEEHYGGEVSLAFVPGDLPLLNTADLYTLTRSAVPDTDTIRLAPAHDDVGTNGVYLSSGSLLRPTFGENSFVRYQRLCQGVGVVPELIHSSTLAHDIDTEADLERLRYGDSSGHTVKYLNSLAEYRSRHVNP